MRARKGAAAISIAALLGTAGLATAAEAATRVDTIGSGLTRVTLLNFNDFHGRIDSGPIDGALGRNFACTIETAKATYGEDSTILLSAGDSIGASIFASSIAEDVPTIEYLNALGLKASAVGNHEFDRGFGDLTGRVAGLAEFDYLGANVYQRGTTTPALPEYSIQTVNGVRVGVIGAVTQETPSLVSPAGVSSIDFGDPVDAVNRVAAQLKDGNEANGEADILVAEYHDGASTASSLADARAASATFNKISTQTSTLVDVIFNGHTHLAYTWDVADDTGTRSLSQSGSYGGTLGAVQLGYDAASGKVVEYNTTNIKTVTAISDACAADPQYIAAEKIVTDAMTLAKELGSVPVAEVTADITTAMRDAAPVEGVYLGTVRDDRARESSLGNLIADAWLWAMNEPGRAGADIGVQNPGGIRSELYYAASGDEGDGVVTYAEAAAVNPFANTMQTIQITGAQFKAVLEQQWQPEGASRPFLKLGLSENVRYTYDPYREAGDRITGVWYDDEPMDMEATFRVAAGSFLISGGDNFTAFQGGTNVIDSGLIDTDAFVNYLSMLETVSPSFEKNGVAVLDVPKTVKRNQGATIKIEGIDMTSNGAPANTEFVVMVGGKQVGTIAIATQRVTEPLPVRDGVSTGELRIGANVLKGNNRYDSSVVDVVLVAKESGTVVNLPGITVTKK